jgi:hypothetical protein
MPMSQSCGDYTISKYLPCHLIIDGSICFIPLFYRYTYKCKVMANICRPPGRMEGWRRRRCENMNQAKEKIIKLKYKDETFFFFRVLGLVFSSSSSSPFSLGQMGVKKKKIG